MRLSSSEWLAFATPRAQNPGPRCLTSRSKNWLYQSISPGFPGMNSSTVCTAQEGRGGSVLDCCVWDTCQSTEKESLATSRTESTLLVVTTVDISILYSVAYPASVRRADKAPCSRCYQRNQNMPIMVVAIVRNIMGRSELCEWCKVYSEVAQYYALTKRLFRTYYCSSYCENKNYHNYLTLEWESVVTLSLILSRKVYTVRVLARIRPFSGGTLTLGRTGASRGVTACKINHRSRGISETMRRI